jgi:hypothetical protein
MPKLRTEVEAVAGRLILAIQKEWHNELGEESASESEEIMHTSHYLLQAAKANTLTSLLGGRTIAQFLGSSWVGRHPRVIPTIKEFQVLIKSEGAI